MSEEKNYRGFNENLTEYYVDDRIFKTKEVKGLKPKELSKKYRELASRQETAISLEEQSLLIDDQDDWVKEVLETYLEFDYDKEVENFDLSVLRKIGAEIFNFLMVVGTSKKEYALSTKQYMEMQKLSKDTKI